MPLKVNSASGAILLAAEDGVGQANVIIPRGGIQPLAALASRSELQAGSVTDQRSVSPALIKQAIQDIAVSVTALANLFVKGDPTVPAFIKTANFSMITRTSIKVVVGGSMFTIAAGTTVPMLSVPAAGTDYMIWVTPAGALEMNTSLSTPATAGSRLIGGFHFAPGENAYGTSGGSTTASINEFSIWDLAYRPSCNDPRGMTCIGGGFWSDIYFLNDNHLVNGTSKYNVNIASGSSPARLPTQFGGTGTTTVGAARPGWDLIGSPIGKRIPSLPEYRSLAYGATASQSGSDPGSTILRAAYTSMYGVMLASGNRNTLVDEFSQKFNYPGNSYAVPYNSGQNFVLWGGAFQDLGPQFYVAGGYWAGGSQGWNGADMYGQYQSNLDSATSVRLVANHLQLVNNI